MHFPGIPGFPGNEAENFPFPGKWKRREIHKLYACISLSVFVEALEDFDGVRASLQSLDHCCPHSRREEVQQHPRLRWSTPHLEHDF